MKLYVGTQTSLPIGPVCMSAVYPPQGAHPPEEVLLDSGAYSDPPSKRLSPLAALRRQLLWEVKARWLWGDNFQVSRLVAYDHLIHHSATLENAEKMVNATIWSNKVLSMWRSDISPRTLVFPIQGLTLEQQLRCLTSTLPLMKPQDWLGLGGWCQIGRFKSWLPLFQEIISTLIPRAAQHGIHHVHIFGVMWLDALRAVQIQCDTHSMTCSTDSRKPLVGRAWNNANLCDMDATPAQQVQQWRQLLLQLP